MMKASICPVTIISSLMVTMRPRRCAGRHLGQEQRAGGRGGADAQAQDDPGRDHHLDVRGERAAQGADQEQAGADQQAALAAQRVGQLAAEQRAEGRAGEQQRADHQRLGGWWSGPGRPSCTAGRRR